MTEPACNEVEIVTAKKKKKAYTIYFKICIHVLVLMLHYASIYQTWTRKQIKGSQEKKKKKNAGLFPHDLKLHLLIRLLLLENN